MIVDTWNIQECLLDVSHDSELVPVKQQQHLQHIVADVRAFFQVVVQGSYSSAMGERIEDCPGFSCGYLLIISRCGIQYFVVVVSSMTGTGFTWPSLNDYSIIAKQNVFVLRKPMEEAATPFDGYHMIIMQVCLQVSLCS